MPGLATLPDGASGLLQIPALAVIVFILVYAGVVLPAVWSARAHAAGGGSRGPAADPRPAPPVAVRASQAVQQAGDVEGSRQGRRPGTSRDRGRHDRRRPDGRARHARQPVVARETPTAVRYDVPDSPCRGDALRPISVLLAGQNATCVRLRRAVPPRHRNFSHWILKSRHWILKSRHWILKSSVRNNALSWSPVTESNRRPSPYHGDALPTELTGPIFRCLSWGFASLAVFSGRAHRSYSV